MASDNEACCESDPNFAVICGFLEKFGVTCGLTNIDFLDLQDMLENNQEVSQELVDLHVKLLRKARKSVSSERWERAIIKLCHGFCSQDAWEIERFGYKKARLSSKLRILKELLEMQFDYNSKFKNEINKLSAAELRTQPLGRDRMGHIYWFQSDNSCQVRVYKEDPDEETWTLVAKDREGLVDLITQLSDGTETVVNEDSNSLESEKPILDTGQTDTKQEQVNVETTTEEVKESEISESSGEKSEISDLHNPEEHSDNLEPAVSAKMENLSHDELNNASNLKSTIQKPTDDNMEKENLSKEDLMHQKTGLNLRIKPITDLISSSSVEVSKKVEVTGVKEKYIRSDSTTTSAHHRKAVDSAGFDVHTNYLKRPIDEEEDVEEPSYIKRPRFDRPTLLGNKKKKPYSEEEEEEDDDDDEDDQEVDEDEEDGVSEEVEEPLMLVKGEGSGHDNRSGNFISSSASIDSPIVGEIIEESVLHFYGEGSGYDCQTGNDKVSNNNKEKHKKSTSSDMESGETIAESSKIMLNEENKAETVDSIKETIPSTSASKLSLKEYKLGTIVDVRTKLNPLIKSPTKKSRWDMGKPKEEVNESQIMIKDVFEEDTSQNMELGFQLNEKNITPDTEANVASAIDKYSNIDSSETSEISSAIPQKSMFFFGPGCLQVKPSLGSFKNNLEIPEITVPEQHSTDNKRIVQQSVNNSGSASNFESNSTEHKNYESNLISVSVDECDSKLGKLLDNKQSNCELVKYTVGKSTCESGSECDKDMQLNYNVHKLQTNEQINNIDCEKSKSVSDSETKDSYERTKKVEEKINTDLDNVVKNTQNFLGKLTQQSDPADKQLVTDCSILSKKDFTETSIEHKVCSDLSNPASNLSTSSSINKDIIEEKAGGHNKNVSLGLLSNNSSSTIKYNQNISIGKSSLESLPGILKKTGNVLTSKEKPKTKLENVLERIMQKTENVDLSSKCKESIPKETVLESAFCGTETNLIHTDKDKILCSEKVSDDLISFSKVGDRTVTTEKIITNSAHTNQYLTLDISQSPDKVNDKFCKEGNEETIKSSISIVNLKQSDSESSLNLSISSPTIKKSEKAIDTKLPTISPISKESSESKVIGNIIVSKTENIPIKEKSVNEASCSKTGKDYRNKIETISDNDEYRAELKRTATLKSVDAVKAQKPQLHIALDNEFTKPFDKSSREKIDAYDGKEIKPSKTAEDFKKDNALCSISSQHQIERIACTENKEEKPLDLKKSIVSVRDNKPQQKSFPKENVDFKQPMPIVQKVINDNIEFKNKGKGNLKELDRLNVAPVITRGEASVSIKEPTHSSTKSVNESKVKSKTYKKVETNAAIKKTIEESVIASKSKSYQELNSPSEVPVPLSIKNSSTNVLKEISPDIKVQNLPERKLEKNKYISGDMEKLIGESPILTDVNTDKSAKCSIENNNSVEKTKVIISQSTICDIKDESDFQQTICNRIFSSTINKSLNDAKCLIPNEPQADKSSNSGTDDQGKDATISSSTDFSKSCPKRTSASSKISLADILSTSMKVPEQIGLSQKDSKSNISDCLSKDDITPTVHDIQTENKNVNEVIHSDKAESKQIDIIQNEKELIDNKKLVNISSKQKENLISVNINKKPTLNKISVKPCDLKEKLEDNEDVDNKSDPVTRVEHKEPVKLKLVAEVEQNIKKPLVNTICSDVSTRRTTRSSKNSNIEKVAESLQKAKQMSNNKSKTKKSKLEDVKSNTSIKKTEVSLNSKTSTELDSNEIPNIEQIKGDKDDTTQPKECKKSVEIKSNPTEIDSKQSNELNDKEQANNLSADIKKDALQDDSQTKDNCFKLSIENTSKLKADVESIEKEIIIEKKPLKKLKPTELAKKKTVDKTKQKKIVESEECNEQKDYDTILEPSIITKGTDKTESTINLNETNKPNDKDPAQEKLESSESQIIDESKKNDGLTSTNKQPVNEPKCIKKKVALLTCVDISTLKDQLNDAENEKPLDDEKSDIIYSDSDADDNVSLLADEASNDSVEIIPETCSLSAKKSPQTTMTLSTFKLDTEESDCVPMRMTRKRAAQQSIDTLREGSVSGQKKETVAHQNTSKKRPKLKSKRAVDHKLRRSVEEKKAIEISSSEDDNTQQPPKLEKQSVIDRKMSKKSKAISKRRVSNRSTKTTDSPPDSDVPSENSKTSNASNTPPHTTKPKKPRQQKRTLLGLEISAETEKLLTTESSPGVRQSRRIAQIKIKEEAERRKLEEVTLQELKEEQRKRKGKKEEDKDYKLEKRKRNKTQVSEDESTGDAESEEKKKRKRKRKHRDPRKQFDVHNPWKSSSGSSSSEVEEEEEEIEEDEENPLVLKSDHEFSPESDLEEGGETQPLKRARTARKESDAEEEIDDCACQKCGQKDHPEWILLCDSCDSGWHCSCLRPALLVIPEGDWFCPPCQHVTLVKNLETQLLEYDKKVNKRDMETRRKERLAYVGISLDNVLPTKEYENYKIKHKHENEGDDGDEEDSDDSDSEDTGSDSESSSNSDSEEEPIYQLRERRQAHSYRFNDYDELINSAIQEDLEAVKGAGNQGRGKDISTIVNAEKEEAEALRLQQENVQDEELPTDLSVNSTVAVETQNTEVEPLPPVVPVEYDKSTKEDSEEDEIRPVKKIIGKKKHRKLNCLDVSSEDDADSDEDFKGSSSSGSDEEPDEYAGSDSSDDLDTRRGRRGKDSGPIRRSTRARISRYDKDFINDDSDSDEEAPRRKKTRSIWDESESEESDRSWGRRKRRAASQKTRKKSSGKPKKLKKKKKRRGDDDSDPEVYRKKPNIKFGGLNDDEEIGRRTRGKKINYLEALGTDSEDEIRRKPPRIEESEDEYIVHEDADFQNANDKDSDESGVEHVLQDLPLQQPRPKPRGRGKAGLKIPRKPKEPVSDIFSSVIPDLSQPTNLTMPSGMQLDASIMPQSLGPHSLINPSLQSQQSLSQSLQTEPLTSQSLMSPLVSQSMTQSLMSQTLMPQSIMAQSMVSQQLPPVSMTSQSMLLNSNIGPDSDLQDLDDEPNPIEQINKNVEQMNEQEMEKMMEEEDYANRQLQLVALQIEKEKKRKEREAKRLENLIPNDQKIPKKRGRKPKNQMLAMSTELASSFTDSSMLMNSPMSNNAELSEPPGVNLPMFSEIAPALNADGTPKKRRGRGKGKKTLAAEAAAIAAAAVSKDNIDLEAGLEGPNSSRSNTVSPAPDSPMHGSKLGIAAPPQPFSQSQPTPSVITRMLQSQPGQGNFPPGTAAKYFGGPANETQLNLSPSAAAFHTGSAGPRGPLNSPYPQAPPGLSHYPVIRSGPPPSHRLHSPGPQTLPPMYHRSLDPSPSGGGTINVANTNRDRNSPAVVSPASSSPLHKGDPTPPPPPYTRHFPVVPASGGITTGPRHVGLIPPHLQQHRGSNMSPYHPGVPPNYHYGSFPPPPPLTSDDGQPPPGYPNAVYPESYPEGGGPLPPPLDGTNPKAFEDDTGGEFVGLVSYFSSQREDDLDT